MKPDYKTLVITMSRAVEEKKSPNHAIGTLQALLWIVLDDLPEGKGKFYTELIEKITKEQG